MDRLRASLSAGFQSGQLTLPVLPMVASRVMTIANDAEADVADLSDLIHKDQALASNVLRIANSAAYRTGEAIVSLRQAVMRLGMAVLSEIAMAACLQSDTFSTPGFDPARKELLLHAFIAGGFARELARQKRRNVEVMFLCGLLHSIGRPVVLHLLCALRRGQPGPPLAEREAVALMQEFQHRAAAAVTLAWNLPQQVQVAAVHYENPAAAPAFVEETRLTALASRLADWVVRGDPVDEAAVRELPAWAELNFYPDEVDGVVGRRAALEEAGAAFAS